MNGMNLEPRRLYRGLHLLRGWGHGKAESVFARSPGAGGASGALIAALARGESAVQAALENRGKRLGDRSDIAAHAPIVIILVVAPSLCRGTGTAAHRADSTA